MSRCIRQWRSLKQAKRGGGGHVADGLASITDGSLALECPACPHPGRNLPQGWDQVLEDKRYVCSSPPCSGSSKHFLVGYTHIISRLMQISVSSSKVVGSMTLKSDRGGHTLSKASNIVSTLLRIPTKK